jgi:hypothetical protein
MVRLIVLCCGMNTQTKVLYDIRIGEGTGKSVDLRVCVLVGTERCKVFVEGNRVYRATLADYADAGMAAGDLVREIVEAQMPDLMPNGRGSPKGAP